MRSREGVYSTQGGRTPPLHFPRSCHFSGQSLNSTSERSEESLAYAVGRAETATTFSAKNCTKKMAVMRPPFSFIEYCQLLNQYLFSLNYAVSINCNNNIDTLNRSRNCCAGRCEVRNCNNLCTLNYEVID